MSLKLKFTTTFTIFVSVLLLIISSGIYIFYVRYRTTDFYRRLRDEGILLYDQYNAINNIKPDSSKLLLQQLNIHRNSYYEEELILFDSSKNILYAEPSSINLNVYYSVFDKAITLSNQEYRFIDGKRNGIAINAGDKYFFIVSAIDKNGLQRQHFLQWFLLWILLLGILLTAFVSYLFVQSLFRPLMSLSAQMQKTTELNLTDRLNEGKHRDELHQIAKSFNAMLERLNQSFESQKNFVHHASHELRTPLATMLSQTELALGKNLSENEYRTLLSSLREDQIAMIDLTNSLLLLSQYERINVTNQWPLVRIDELLMETIGSARRMLNGIEIDLDFINIPDDEKDLMLHGNEALLKVAFSNLIKNAWQYSVNKKVMLSIDASNKYIHVLVDNYGQHLSASEIEKLKVPFFRGSNAVAVKGFGLGLSIVHRIVSLHAGTFDYSAIKPNINRFTVHFKLN